MGTLMGLASPFYQRGSFCTMMCVSLSVSCLQEHESTLTMSVDLPSETETVIQASECA